MAAVSAKRAYVLVLDGCKPGEVEAMPTVKALREAGRWFPRAASLPVMETIPNHTMMMTGVRPNRSGVPTNSVYDRKEKVVRDLDRPADMRFPTVLERLKAKGVVTATALSKEYLNGIFNGKATHQWAPQVYVPGTGHVFDPITMQGALGLIDTHDPQLLFINLGDIDRIGHGDITGTNVRLLRSTALQTADQQVKALVDKLKTKGYWANSILIVLADHSMDWSDPIDAITLTDVLNKDASLKGNFQIAQNGGADMVYYTGPAAGRDAAVAKMLTLIRKEPGVLAAYDVPRTPSLKLGSMAGDVLAYCKWGYRFSDSTAVSNPIPGNHGHPATAPIPFFISGGHPVARRAVLPHFAHTVDVAPTVGAFLGLSAPSGGYDGVSRI